MEEVVKYQAPHRVIKHFSSKINNLIRLEIISKITNREVILIAMNNNSIARETMILKAILGFMMMNNSNKNLIKINKINNSIVIN